MAKILDLKSRVPEGKYKATIIEDSLIHDRKEIMNLIKKVIHSHLKLWKPLVSLNTFVKLLQVYQL